MSGGPSQDLEPGHGWSGVNVFALSLERAIEDHLLIISPAGSSPSRKFLKGRCSP